MSTTGTDDALLLGVEERYFNEFAIPDLEFIDPTVASSDLHRLQSSAGPIRKWVNRGLAHYAASEQEFETKLTIKDLHDALDLLFELVNKYNRLINHATIHGEITFPQWRDGFRIAWVSDDA